MVISSKKDCKLEKNRHAEEVAKFSEKKDRLLNVIFRMNEKVETGPTSANLLPEQPTPTPATSSLDRMAPVDTLQVPARERAKRDRSKSPKRDLQKLVDDKSDEIEFVEADYPTVRGHTLFTSVKLWEETERSGGGLHLLSVQ